MLNAKLKTQNIFYSIILIDLILIFLHLIWGRNVSFVNLDLEYNLPAFYSGFKLVIIGSLALSTYFILTFSKQLISQAWYWLVLGGMFIYLGVDEVLGLHERVAHFLSTEFLSELGWYDNEVFYWTAIFIPLIILAVVFLIYFYQKVLLVNSRSKKYFLIGLSLFALVIVLEVVGGIFSDSSLGYHIMTIEETSEIIGTSFFLGAVLSYFYGIKSKENY